MPRPIIRRRISEMPAITCFMPSDDVEGGTPENILKLEELEAIRLKDLDGLDQTECAARMAVSRPTFQRILLSAREKVADSLLHGKAIRIEGGVYIHIAEGRGYCKRCGRSWALPAIAQADATDALAAAEHVPTQPGGPVVPAILTEDGTILHGANPVLCPKCVSERTGRGKGGRRMGQGNGPGGGTETGMRRGPGRGGHRGN